MSKKLPFGKQDLKYFIGYKDVKKLRHLCIFYPKINIYKRNFYGTECMYFSIKDEKILEIYNESWRCYII